MLTLIRCFVRRVVRFNSRIASFLSLCAVFFLLTVYAPHGWANHGALRVNPFNTNPVDSSGHMTSSSSGQFREYLDHEIAQHAGRYSSSYVHSGGLHGTSSTLTSAIFATEAFTPERVNQTGSAIAYAAIANDVCWTIISSDNNGITGWTRVGSGSTGAYYYQCEGDTTPNKPALPPNSAWLSQSLIASNAIATVIDMRESNSRGNGTFNVKDPLWGCIGDGITDDTACWQRIADRYKNQITTLNNTYAGYRIEVPLGVYLITDTVNWGRSIAPKIIGTGNGVYMCTSVPGSTCIKWGGTTGKPIWLFTNGTIDVGIEGLSFDGADEAVRFRNTGGGTEQNKMVRFTRVGFNNQTVSSIWIGYPIVDTTSDMDATRFIIEQSFFDTAAYTGVTCNVASNMYGLIIRDSTFTGSNALVSQGCQNISIENVEIIKPASAILQYAIYFYSGGGYLKIDGLYIENGRIINVVTWSGSAGKYAQVSNVIVNSTETYADINSVPSILMNPIAVVFTNVQVSNASGSIIRRIAATDYVVIGTSTSDIYEDPGGIFIGRGLEGHRLDVFQRIVGVSNKGIRVQRASDSAPTGRVIDVGRRDNVEATSPWYVEASGRQVSLDDVVSRRFLTNGDTLAGLGTASTGVIAFCTNCNRNTSPCTAGGPGAFDFASGGIWECHNFP